MKLIFTRGKGQIDETKPLTVMNSLRSIDDKLFNFRGDSFGRSSHFFIKNGQVEDKKANIRIVKL